MTGMDENRLNSNEELKIPPAFAEVSFIKNGLDELSEDEELVLFTTPRDFNFSSVNLKKIRLNGRLKTTKGNANKKYYKVRSDEMPMQKLSSYAVLIPNAKSGKLSPTTKRISNVVHIREEEMEEEDLPSLDLPADHNLPSCNSKLKASWVLYGSSEYLKPRKKSKVEEDDKVIDEQIVKKKHKSKSSKVSKEKSIHKKRKHDNDD